MDLGTALFLSTILVLVVLNAKFRKFFFWFAGIAVVLGAISFAGIYLYDAHQARLAAKNDPWKAFDGVPAPVPAPDYADHEVKQETPIDLSAGLVPKDKAARKSRTKTGTVTSETFLSVDTCEHPSSMKVPAGSKVKILGRTNLQPPCFLDLVKVSFEGTTGWVSAPYVQEDVATQPEKPAR